MTSSRETVRKKSFYGLCGEWPHDQCFPETNGATQRETARWLALTSMVDFVPGDKTLIRGGQPSYTQEALRGRFLTPFSGPCQDTRGDSWPRQGFPRLLRRTGA